MKLPDHLKGLDLEPYPYVSWKRIILLMLTVFDMVGATYLLAPTVQQIILEQSRSNTREMPWSETQVVTNPDDFDYQALIFTQGLAGQEPSTRISIRDFSNVASNGYSPLHGVTYNEIYDGVDYTDVFINGFSYAMTQEGRFFIDSQGRDLEGNSVQQFDPRLVSEPLHIENAQPSWVNGELQFTLVGESGTIYHFAVTLSQQVVKINQRG